MSHLPVSVVLTRHTLNILPHLCFLCTLSHFNVFLYYNCLFLSATFLSLAPSLSAPTHLLSALIFILSCSSPLLLSSLSQSLLFPFLPFLSFSPLPLSHALLSHTSFSMLRWESHNASEEKGSGGVPFLHSIHTSSGEDVRERCNVWREKICGNICHRHTTEGYSVPPLHSDVTLEYS